MTKYPNFKEILRKKNKFSKKEIATIIVWKSIWFKNWKRKSKKQQIQGLRELILNFCEALELSNPDIIEGTEYYYQAEECIDGDGNQDVEWIDPIISIDKKHPSIISTLHEIEHHINGDSELKACRWSTQLFKNYFTKDYNNLKWKGHMLVKK
jgi:hypothetical protein